MLTASKRIHLPRIFLLSAATASLLTISTTTLDAQERDQIRIVGSSTVYPFSSYVAEEFGKTTRFKTPIVESTGSGGGQKLFGDGIGTDHPDITNSSRRMKVSEFERARANGVDQIAEAVIGYDGIAVAFSKNNPAVDFSLRDLALAVAAEVPDPRGSGKLIKNPYKTWNQISDKLPGGDIKIYGPPMTSGTRDAFEELVLESATAKIPGYTEPYTKIRDDGAWINAGENDNLIVQRLANDAKAFGVLGFSFLDENRDKIQGALVDSVAPTPDAISSGKYPVSRSLFFYIKCAHAGEVPGLMDYVQLFMSEKMIGRKGALRTIGLVPLPDQLRAASRDRVLKLVPMKRTAEGLSTLEEYAEGK